METWEKKWEITEEELERGNTGLKKDEVKKSRGNETINKITKCVEKIGWTVNTGRTVVTIA